ncbi:LysR family transcriptional regulator [Yoonia sp.]|nr:LysR family transcriptional regulator [Yoonia sp.]
MNNRRPHLPSTRCLLAFEASARLQSFTAAAQQLNTSQSSISRSRPRSLCARDSHLFASAAIVRNPPMLLLAASAV